ncbi:MAG: hypothetical protein V7754_13495 [Halioglobus sp.]
MTMIEYRITRDLLQRRENASRGLSAGYFIKGLAALTAVAVVSVCVPHLLLPILVASVVLSLGL